MVKLLSLIAALRHCLEARCDLQFVISQLERLAGGDRSSDVCDDIAGLEIMKSPLDFVSMLPRIGSMEFDVSHTTTVHLEYSDEVWKMYIRFPREIGGDDEVVESYKNVTDFERGLLSVLKEHGVI